MSKDGYLISMLGGCLLIQGCATSSNGVSSSYASSLKYADNTCKQLVIEQEEINIILAQKSATLDGYARKDKLITPFVIVSYGLLYGMYSGKEADVLSSEIARLKGETEAVSRVLRQKNCNAADIKETQTS